MKYDVIYGAEGWVDVQPHYCREWDDGVGCYGTNEDHGFTWAEAIEEVAKWHEAKAEEWRKRPEDRLQTIGALINKICHEAADAINELCAARPEEGYVEIGHLIKNSHGFVSSHFPDPSAIQVGQTMLYRRDMNSERP